MPLLPQDPNQPHSKRAGIFLILGGCRACVLVTLTLLLPANLPLGLLTRFVMGDRMWELAASSWEMS